jgi:hypothetical protein
LLLTLGSLNTSTRRDMLNGDGQFGSGNEGETTRNEQASESKNTMRIDHEENMA